MAIRAAENHIRAAVHGVFVNALVAFEATGALGVRVGPGLVNEIARFGLASLREIARDGNRRPEGVILRRGRACAEERGDTEENRLLTVKNRPDRAFRIRFRVGASGSHRLVGKCDCRNYAAVKKIIHVFRGCLGCRVIRARKWLVFPVNLA